MLENIVHYMVQLLKQANNIEETQNMLKSHRMVFFLMTPYF
jgi:hypothetical protein